MVLSWGKVEQSRVVPEVEPRFSIRRQTCCPHGVGPGEYDTAKDLWATAPETKRPKSAPAWPGEDPTPPAPETFTREGWPTDTIPFGRSARPRAPLFVDGHEAPPFGRVRSGGASDLDEYANHRPQSALARDDPAVKLSIGYVARKLRYLPNPAFMSTMPREGVDAKGGGGGEALDDDRELRGLKEGQQARKRAIRGKFRAAIQVTAQGAKIHRLRAAADAESSSTEHGPRASHETRPKLHSVSNVATGASSRHGALKPRSKAQDFIDDVDAMDFKGATWFQKIMVLENRHHRSVAENTESIQARTRELQSTVRSVVKDSRNVIDQRCSQRLLSQRPAEDDAQQAKVPSQRMGARGSGASRNGRAHASSGSHAGSSSAEQLEGAVKKVMQMSQATKPAPGVPRKGPSRRKKISEEIAAKLQMKLKAACVGTTADKVLKRYDKSKDGTLDEKELTDLVRRNLKIGTGELADADIAALVAALDDDGGGSVSIDELADFIERGSATFFEVGERTAPAEEAAPVSPTRLDPNLVLLKREMRSHIAAVRAQGWSEDQHAAAVAQKTAWMGKGTEKRGAF